MFFRILFALTLLWHVPAQAGSRVEFGEITSQPIGHYKFCQKHPGECTASTNWQGELTYNRTLWQLLQRITIQVNHSIEAVTDLDYYGTKELWTYPEKGAGDCEDYVLEKRRLLNTAGIPFSHLLIVVARQANGQGHALLLVRTSEGDFILDNLDDRVRPWNKTNYRFVKVQTPENAGRWRTIKQTNVRTTAATK